ncbi:MAG: hypothetical protein WDW36_003991 [Sanguina aurantia]
MPSSLRASSSLQGGPAPSTRSNRLASEQSPYLRQHMHNPVDWYPWGPEALQKAKAEDKLIFLSVGYATCRWCHVMERESFESEETAAILNKHYVCVKVDREERPDVDKVYMTYVQAVTGSGGWPMSVFLTPTLEPVYGGTYYPPKDRMEGGRLVLPGFQTVLRRLSNLWGTSREDLMERALNTQAQLMEAFASGGDPIGGTSDANGATPSGADKAGPSASSAALSPSVITLAEGAISSCVQQLAERFDAQRGGFGSYPKFPRPAEINLLLVAALLSGKDPSAPQVEVGSADGASASPLHMALFSLRRMAAGGMFDHLGGGFHRYSVDEFFHVPHFEKMLYDNTQLASTYLAAYQATGDEQYAQVARGVLDYMRRGMTHPEGGLFCAEDAESFDGQEGVGVKAEGAFYIWRAEEIAAVLSAEDAAMFNAAYGVKSDGNCTLSPASDPHEEFIGRNVLMRMPATTPASHTSAAAPPSQSAAAAAPPPPAQAQAPSAGAAAGAAAVAGGATGHSRFTPSAGSGSGAAETEARLAACRWALFEARRQRPKPVLDNKIITAWNGLAISALASASRVLTQQQQRPPRFPVDSVDPSLYLDAAAAAAAFVRTHLWDPDAQQLLRSYCSGPSVVEGFAEDYAYLIAGLLDLYEAGGGVEHLEWAIQLQGLMDARFWDGRGAGAYFSTGGTDPSITMRLKEDYDGAEPSPSSIALSNLMRLAGLVPGGAAAGGDGKPEPFGETSSTAGVLFEQRAQATLSAFQGRLSGEALALPQMCAASYLILKGSTRQVIICGRLSSPDTQALLNAAHASFTPDKALILVDPHDHANLAFWSHHNPEAVAMVATHFASPRRQSSAAPHAASQAQTDAASPAAPHSDAPHQAVGPSGVDTASRGTPSDGSTSSSAGSSCGSLSEAAAALLSAATLQHLPATAFLCQNFTCQSPTSDPARVRSQAPGGGPQPFDLSLLAKLSV